MSHITQLVSSIRSGSMTSAMEAFKSAMNQRLATAIQDKRQETADSIFKEEEEGTGEDDAIAEAKKVKRGILKNKSRADLEAEKQKIMKQNEAYKKASGKIPTSNISRMARLNFAMKAKNESVDNYALSQKEPMVALVFHGDEEGRYNGVKAYAQDKGTNTKANRSQKFMDQHIENGGHAKRKWFPHSKATDIVSQAKTLSNDELHDHLNSHAKD